MFALLPILALLVGVSAQDSAATEIAVVQARFEGAQLVPQFLPSFSPEGTLDVTFGGQAITTGETLEQSAVASAPELSITPAEDATRFADTALYTVIMADADVPGTDLANTPQTRHWLVNTVSISAEGEGSYPLNFTGSTAITDYAGPGPAEGSGPHRYVVLVYSQPGAFTPPAELSEAGTPLGTFQVQEYVNSTGLGALVAANYFTVEVGQATASIPATMSVDPATVSAAESTSTASTITSGMASQSSGMSTMRSMTSGASAMTDCSQCTRPVVVVQARRRRRKKHLVRYSIKSIDIVLVFLCVWGMQMEAVTRSCCHPTFWKAHASANVNGSILRKRWIEPCLPSLLACLLTINFNIILASYNSCRLHWRGYVCMCGWVRRHFGLG